MNFTGLFFILTIPLFSSAYTAEKFENDDNNRRLLEESKGSFAEGFGMLITLSKKDYAPAQQFLALVTQDIQQAKHFLKEHKAKDLMAVTPSLGPFKSLVRQIYYGLKNDITPFVEEANNFQWSVFYLEALEKITKAFHLLDILKKNNYYPAITFQNNFENNIATAMQQTGFPVYGLSLDLNLRCAMIFKDYFAPRSQKN